MVPPPRLNKVKKPVFNPFEQAIEFGKKTAIGIGTDLLNTFNPAGPVELSHSDNPQQEQMKNLEHKKENKNHTPLDFKELGESYRKNESQDIDAVRRRFNQFKSDEEKVFQQGKQKIEQAKQMDQNQKAEEQQRLQKQAASQPGESHGKQKGRLGQARKKASVDTNFEAKYAKGK